VTDDDVILIAGVLLLGRISVLCVRRCGLLLPAESVVCRSICLSVCRSFGLSVTPVSPAKTAEPIKMSFGLWTRIGPENPCYELYACVQKTASV